MVLSYLISHARTQWILNPEPHPPPYSYMGTSKGCVPLHCQIGAAETKFYTSFNSATEKWWGALIGTVGDGKLGGCSDWYCWQLKICGGAPIVGLWE
uniref:Uncharacterized protein n=1 Tax=Fagus sylvatica TaxID=28930 RepID=A0A2N9F5Y6_FAGSY